MSRPTLRDNETRVLLSHKQLHLHLTEGTTLEDTALEGTSEADGARTGSPPLEEDLSATKRRREDAAATEKEDPKKRRIKPKNLERPKPGRSALRCYMRRHVRELRRRNPEASEAQLKVLLSAAWDRASAEERKEMNRRSDLDKQRFGREQADFERQQTARDKAAEDTSAEVTAPEGIAPEGTAAESTCAEAMALELAAADSDSDGDECPVCLEVLDAATAVLLDCMHVFCATCHEEKLSRHPSSSDASRRDHRVPRVPQARQGRRDCVVRPSEARTHAYI